VWGVIGVEMTPHHCDRSPAASGMIPDAFILRPSTKARWGSGDELVVFGVIIATLGFAIMATPIGLVAGPTLGIVLKPHIAIVPGKSSSHTTAASFSVHVTAPCLLLWGPRCVPRGKVVCAIEGIHAASKLQWGRCSRRRRRRRRRQWRTDRELEKHPHKLAGVRPVEQQEHQHGEEDSGDQAREVATAADTGEVPSIAHIPVRALRSVLAATSADIDKTAASTCRVLATNTACVAVVAVDHTTSHRHCTERKPSTPQHTGMKTA